MLNEPDEFGVIKAVSRQIDLGNTILDAYLLPDGEKRLGIEKIGIALGYTERWFYNRTKRRSKWLKALQDKGFTGAQIEVRVIRQSDDGEFLRGSSVSKTVSLRDFTKLTAFEAIANRNFDAIVLLAAFAEVGLERTIEDVFAGRSIDFLLEKIVHYSKWTYEELEQALADNREDVQALYGWGLPPSLEL
jgi:hypothetical protein